MEQASKAPERSMPVKERRVQFLRQQSVEVAPTVKKPLVRANTVAGSPQPHGNMGMASSMMDALVVCTMCSQRLNSPKMLPCQHTFCLTCLQACVQADRSLRCPTCSMAVQLLGEVADLPPNIYVNTLLSAMEAATPARPQQQQRCVKCQTVGRGPKCQHCKQMFCRVCWPGHVLELRAQLGSLTDQLQAASETLKHRLQDFKDRCEKLHEHIDQAVEEKMAALREQGASLAREAQELEAQGDRSAGELHGKLITAESNVSFLAFDKVTEDTEKVSLFMLLHGMTSDFLDAVSHWSESRPTLDRDTFKIYYQEDAETADEEDDQEVVEVADVRKQEELVSTPDGLSLYYRSRRCDVPRLSVSKNRLQRPAGLGVAPWNQGLVYVAATDNGAVLVMDRVRGRLVASVSAPDMSCPQGVAFSRTRLYVTDKWNNRIHVFDQHNNYLHGFGKKGNGDGQFRSPEGIATGVINEDVDDTDSNVLLYVCDTGNDRLQVLRASDGSFVKYLGLTGKAVNGKRVTELYQPTDVVVTEDKIVVSDSGNRRIKTYSLSGVKMSEFGSHGGARGQFRSPECLAVDRLGFILVGDSGNARIQIFRPNGNLVRTIGGKREGAHRFGWISGIAVTDSRDIIVADCKNHCVQIF